LNGKGKFWETLELFSAVQAAELIRSSAARYMQMVWASVPCTEDCFASAMDFVEAFTEVTQGDTSAPTSFFDV